MTANDTSNTRGQKYWRSLSEEAESPEFLEKMKNEFPNGLAELSNIPPVDRRKFLGVMGASIAFAGATSLSGCIRKPRDLIMPYNTRPEDLIPGRPQYFASSLRAGGSVFGVVVESHEGRPTKIEGNTLHPMSMGATNAYAQAMILDLYDPDRSKTPRASGEPASLEGMRQFFATHFAGLKKESGRGLAILTEWTSSPTMGALYSEIQSAYPNARFYMNDAAYPQEKVDAFRMIGRSNARVLYAFDRAEVVVSADSDFVNVEGDSVRNARLFADRRRMPTESASMNRLYVVSPTFNSTAISADHRLRLSASRVGEFLLALANSLNGMGARFTSEVTAQLNKQNSVAAEHAVWVSAVAKDLFSNRGRSIVIAGESQPAWVQALAFAINDALGNTGETVNFVQDVSLPEMGSAAALVKSMQANEVNTLVMMGGNPVYDLPADLGFTDLLKNTATSVHLSSFFDETSKVSKWHVPRSHVLEAWGDTRASDGTVSIQQPLIAPLYETISDLEFVSMVLSAEATNSYDALRSRWQNARVANGDFEKAWRRWLHDGVVAEQRTDVMRDAFRFAELGQILAGYQTPAAASSSSLEIVFPLSSSVYDGTFANNAWMQELPDPASKLTWDNAALVSPSTAKTLQVANEEVVTLAVDGRSIEVPVLVTPGVAENSVVLYRGFGRDFGGAVSTGAGVNANLLRTSANSYFAFGATLKKIGKTYPLALTQEHGLLEGRNIVRENTVTGYQQDPTFVDKQELMKKDMHRSLLWEEPNATEGYQWGMSIDLNVCNSCNACTVACNAENNIPVVGKDQVRRNREMHWIRIDRYFTGSVDDPQAVVQPMLCQHCENAPCESVCPVAATVHSPDGINEMTYNRCVGTRYCANNCPYKVRRFNFLSYAKNNEEAAPLAGMQKNPNVTVRFRGVMEKCTYCVQRISEAKIEAKLNNTMSIPDGRVVTACQQVCPTKAIVFGNINDAESAVSKAKKQKRDYVVLGELNTQPRTSYLAKLRNQNPELG